MTTRPELTAATQHGLILKGLTATGHSEMLWKGLCRGLQEAFAASFSGSSQMSVGE
jgi:hypothetical protein